MQFHEFDPTILREYDIRGIVDKTLKNEDALAIGKSFGTIVRRTGGSRVCVGFDGRFSSPVFEEHLVAGLMSTGLEVIRVGCGPTPMLYFSVFEFNADGGVMITGSHNPPDYNGFKMLLGKSAFYGHAIQELGAVAKMGDWVEGEGSVTNVDIHDRYVARLVKDYLPGNKDLKVVWDAGNGATGDRLKDLVKLLPGEHHVLFADIDGAFPNHHPDPTIPENLVSLQKKVAEVGADLGVAFDGDGDRIGAVDADGKIVWGDQLIAIYASEILQEQPEAPVISDVKSSQTIFDEIARLGGKPIMWKSGHSLVKAKMKEIQAPLAGEMSGHIFFADKFYGYDDALYCAVRLISLLARSDETLGQMRDRLPPVFNTPEIRFEVDPIRKFAVPHEILTRLKQNDADIVDVDGVRVKTPDGWWLMRSSNTQDVLTVRAEAMTQEGLKRVTDQVKEQLALSQIDPPAELG